MNFYTLLTFGILILLPSIPYQLSYLVSNSIIFYSVLLIPVFIRNLRKDLVNRFVPTIFFLIFLGISFISVFSSLDRERSWYQWVLFVSFFIVFGSVKSIFNTFEKKELGAAALVTISFFLSLVSLYNTLIAGVVNKEAEGVSFLWVYYGHNHLSALLIFAIPLLFYFLITYWSSILYRVLLMGVGFVLICAFLFTFARASLLSLFLSSMFFLFLLFIRKFHIVIFISSLLFLLLSVFISGYTGGAQLFGVSKFDLDSESRAQYFQIAIENGLSHPLLGTGLDTYRLSNFSRSIPILPTYYAHNHFLQMFSDTGIFGSMVSIGLIGSVLWTGYFVIKKKHKANRLLISAIWIGIFASTINAMLDFDWQLPFVFFIFWVLSGVMTDYELPDKHNS